MALPGVADGAVDGPAWRVRFATPRHHMDLKASREARALAHRLSHRRVRVCQLPSKAMPSRDPVDLWNRGAVRLISFLLVVQTAVLSHWTMTFISALTFILSFHIPSPTDRAPVCPSAPHSICTPRQQLPIQPPS